MILPYSNASSKRMRRRLLLQILLQNPFMNGQNGCLQLLGWLVGWLHSLIFMTPACVRWKWLALCASLLSNYSLPFS